MEFFTKLKPFTSQTKEWPFARRRSNPQTVCCMRRKQKDKGFRQSFQRAQGSRRWGKELHQPSHAAMTGDYVAQAQPIHSPTWLLRDLPNSAFPGFSTLHTVHTHPGFWEER